MEISYIMPIINKISFRKGTSSEWTTSNPVLASGEPGYDLTNNVLKIGDGTTSWNSLDPIGGGGSVSNETIDDRVSNLLVAGSGINLNYNDSADTLTISVSGISSSESIGSMLYLWANFR